MLGPIILAPGGGSSAASTIKSESVDPATGHLIITFDDGSTEDAGVFAGALLSLQWLNGALQWQRAGDTQWMTLETFAPSATTDATDAGNIASGTLAAARLPASGVTAGTYGDPAHSPQVAVDEYGRVTNVSPQEIELDASAIGSGTLAAARLPASGVAAGAYGDGAHSLVIEVDAAGRITGVSLDLIGVSVDQVAGLAPSAIVDTTNAANITGGELSPQRFPPTGIEPGAYGSAAPGAPAFPVITVDAYGRVTGAANVPLTAELIPGLAASATTDTTNAGNIASGTLSAARLPASGVARARTAMRRRRSLSKSTRRAGSLQRRKTRLRFLPRKFPALAAWRRKALRM